MMGPRAGEPTPGVDPRVALAWIDALSNGTCDEAAFLKALPTFTRDTPDAGWGLLSLIDQYYRRGKISSESFLHLKVYLESRLIRPGFDDGVSVPLPRQAHALPLADRTVPIFAPMPTAGPAAPAAPPKPLAAPTNRHRIAVGERLRDRYLIKGVLGSGGMGTVFEAVDQYRLNLADATQGVALKVLHGAVSERPELHDELRREFQHLQALSHPSIVRVHEYDRDGDVAFFTMELLKGRTLAHALAEPGRERPARAQALSIVRSAGAALAFAHARGIVHGDLNPGNIFITDGGEVRVLDFGSSHRLRSESGPAPSEAADRPPTATPRYASCQVLKGDAAEARDDVYAFACIIYLLLTGTHPFGERTALEARSSALTPARPESVDEDQWQALLAGLSFERAARPPNVQAWLAPFAEAQAPTAGPAMRSRRLPASIAGALSALLALMIGWWIIGKYDRVTDAGLPPERAALATAKASAPVPPGESAAQVAESKASEPQNAGAKVDSVPRAPETDPNPASVAPTPSPAPEAPVVMSPSGHSHIELAASTLELPAMSPAARVVVRRNGSLQSDARFSWWTESGTAKPGQDFEAVTAHEELIERGKSAVSLYIPIIADSTRREPKNFYVMIGEPTEGASLGARTLMMVTVPAQP